MVRRARPAALVALVFLSACVGPSEPIPQGLRTYLDALVAQRYRAAYDVTQLGELHDDFGQGASLSYEHFEAFHRATPVTDYSVDHVTRLATRAIDAPANERTAFFEVDMTLHLAGGRRAETVTVLGEVLPRVQVEPDRLFLELPEGTRRIVVDGVRTPVRSAKIFDGRTAYPVLLLRGRHVVEVGDAKATIETFPARVVAGRASLVRDGDQSAVVRIP